ncbi:MAG: BrnT family toxin [Anaerolineales bacterium]|nr:BrnT family toxin [Anaerolineales bacterium]
MTKRKPLKFNWDAEKAEKNIEKHGVSFDEVVVIFKDRHALYFDDPQHSQKEIRETIVGWSNARKKVLTCFFTRSEDVVTIIGARIATHRESQLYDDSQDIDHQIER